MEELLSFMESFERRNNISISIEINSDGSGNLKEFWDGEEIKPFDNFAELTTFLENGKLKMENGSSIKPIVIDIQ